MNVDETHAALQYAGPTSWHHLIAPTRTLPLTEFSIHSIANSIFTADAHTIFKDASTTAATLDKTNKNLPQFTPNVSTYKHVAGALRTNSPQVLSMLLVDIIRTTNHITES